MPSKELQQAFGPAHAIVASVLARNELPFGKCKFILAEYERFQALIVPFTSQEVVIVLGLSPGSNAKNIAEIVRKRIIGG